MRQMGITVGMALLLGIAGVAQAGVDANAGKIKAERCAGCHGANGQGTAPNTALAGKDEKKLLQEMKEYKSGKRENAMMKSAMAPLGDQEMADLAAYYASLKGK